MAARHRYRRIRRTPSAWRALCLTAAASFVLGLGVGYLVARFAEPSSTTAERAQVVSRGGENESREIRPEITTAPETEEPPPSPVELTPYPRGEGARVALVIDDLGRSLNELVELRGLGVPLSYAVLPYETRTEAVVSNLRERGEEILCHLPMEPRNGANPGPGALTRNMTRRELVRATRDALQQTPGAVGVNNHMGSRLSVDRRAMKTVLGILAGDGLFYLDSRTSADSLGYRMALEAGLPAAERQVFLDAESQPETVRQQFGRLLELAKGRGAAIAIGHPSDTTLGVLRREIPRALRAGYEFVPVSYLLDRAEVLPAP
jgi:polysaccharide deacetylase 2 family uncharacterized protein YibQ